MKYKKNNINNNNQSQPYFNLINIFKNMNGFTFRK